MIDERSVANSILMELSSLEVNVDNRNFIIEKIEKVTTPLRNERTDLRAALLKLKGKLEDMAEPLGNKHDYTVEDIDRVVCDFAVGSIKQIDTALEQSYGSS